MSRKYRRHAIEPRTYAPVGPFAEAIVEWVELQRNRPKGLLATDRDYVGIGTLAARAGLPARRLRSYVAGECRYIALPQADRLAIALDIPLCLLAEDFRTIAEWQALEAEQVPA